MFTIELMGLPGSGKSTIIPKLTKKLNKQEKRIFYTVDQAFLMASRLYTDHPFRIVLNKIPNFMAQFFLKKLFNRTIFQSEKKDEFILKYSEAIDFVFKRNKFQSMDYKDKKFVISGLLDAGSLYEAIKTINNFNGVVLFDQGFVQCSLIIGSPADSAFDIDELKQYLEFFPIPDLVIYIKADIETCYHRMANRRKGLTFRLDGIEKEKVLESLETLNYVFDQLGEFLKNKGVPIFSVSSMNTLESTILKIEDVLLPSIEQILGKG